MFQKLHITQVIYLEELKQNILLIGLCVLLFVCGYRILVTGKPLIIFYFNGVLLHAIHKKNKFGVP